MPGEPNPYGSAPRATGGTVQPRSPRGPKLTAPKTVNVKAHTRVIKPKAPTNGGTPKTNGGTPAIDPTTKSLIDAAVRLKFGNQEQGINQQLQQNARFTSGAPTWYQQAIQQIQAQAQPVPQNAMPAPTGDPATDSRNAAAYGFQQQRNNALTAGNTFLTNVGAGLTAAQGNTLNAANAQRQGLLSQQTQLKGNEGDFRTTTLAGLQAAEAKAANDAANLKVKQDTVNYLTGNAKSEAQNRVAGQKAQRSKIRLGQAQLKEKTTADQAATQAKQDAAAAKSTTNATNNAQKRAQFIAKYGLPPERVEKMTPGQLSNFAKKNPQFSGYAHPKSGVLGPTPFSPTQVRTGQKAFRKALNTIKTYGLGPGDAGTLDAFGITDPLLGKVAMLWSHHKQIDGGTRQRFVRQYGFDPAKGF